MKKKVCYLFILSICSYFYSCQQEFETIPDQTGANGVELKLRWASNIDTRAGINPGCAKTASIELKNHSGSIFRLDSIPINNSAIELSLKDDSYEILSLKVYDEIGLRYRLSKENENRFLVVQSGSAGTNASVLLVQYSSYPFDWESATTVSNDPSLPILPWLSGASTGVPRKLSTDNKQEDGWEMMHNSFKLTTGGSDSKKYLLFYNKYSGTLRMWYWYEGSTNYSSLKYAIQVPNTSTALFNFNHEFAQPMDVRQPGYAEYISGNPEIMGSSGLIDKTWYMFDFELAYDDLAAQTVSDRSDLFISTRGINMTTLNLTGSQSGKINGQVVMNATPNAGLFNLSNPTFNINGKTNTISSAVNMVVNTGDSEDWGAQVIGSVDNKLKSTVTNFVTTLSSKGAGMVVKTAGGFLNSLMHRQTSTSAAVNLSLQTNINMEGQLTTQLPVSITNLHLPGTLDSPDGLVYLYDEPFGVFNLSATPVVKWQQTFYKGGVPKRHYQYFDIDRTSFQFVVNPALQHEITILNQETYLMFYQRFEGVTNWTSANPHSDDTLFHPEGNNRLMYKTDRKGGINYFRDGYEFYYLEEGSRSPLADDEYGLIYTDKNSLLTLWENTYELGHINVDQRVVVKAALKFRINSTGREVTIIKTYRPTFVRDQQRELVE